MTDKPNWDRPHGEGPWNPPKFRCLKCEDVIWSKWSGHFVPCLCGAIFVDQTRHYSRYGGHPEDFEEVKDEDE